MCAYVGGVVHLPPALQVTHAILSFDYFGTGNDAAADLYTVQLTSDWNALVGDLTLFPLFFEVYHFCCEMPDQEAVQRSEPPSTLALSCLVQLASLRASIYSTKEARCAAANTLLTGCAAIMRRRTGLKVSENVTALSLMMARLWSAFPLDSLFAVPSFGAWLAALVTFSQLVFSATDRE
jgi:hypothetical protein